MKLCLIQRLCVLSFVLILSCAACGESSTPNPTQAPPPTAVPAEGSAISPTTPANPTIAPPTEVHPTEEEPTMPFEILSSEFASEEPIPVQFTCDGENISPPLRWSDPPEGTQSFALINDDPDAPGRTWVHWVLYNIPAEARELPEAIPAEDELADGSLHGINDFGRLDYGGPCPPGGTHRYFFKLYALDVMLEFEPGVDKAGLLESMEGHVLAEAEWMGTYSR
jgi:Raf kinase inhibitor-like YbhB/YbcL family protein